VLAGLLGAIAIVVPTSMGSAVAAEEPPCIPSPSIPPSFGDQCGQDPGVEMTRSTDHYEVDMPVSAPVEEGHTAGNAIARFGVPVRPNIGVIRVGLFIAARYLPGTPPGLDAYGNGRDFDENFDANRTKLTLELNFKTGEGTAWATPSCAKIAGKTLCHSALALDSNSTGSNVISGSKERSDQVKFEVNYTAKQSFTEGIPGVRSLVTAISGDVDVVIGNDDSLCLKGSLDPYPSVEIYLYTPNSGVIMLYQDKESGIPEINLSPFVDRRQVLKCTDRL
jgi:hypothetical protein